MVEADEGVEVEGHKILRVLSAEDCVVYLILKACLRAGKECDTVYFNEVFKQDNTSSTRTRKLSDCLRYVLLQNVFYNY